MPRFVFVFRGDSADPVPLSPAEMAAHVRAWYTWADRLRAAGHDPKGIPLERGGRTVRGAGRLVTDGPYAEAMDRGSGNLSISAASRDEAVELAKGCPGLDLGGSVEVRHVAEHDV